MTNNSIVIEKGWTIKKRSSLLILIALFLVLSLIGCNTAKGAGEDIEKAGKDIQKAVDK